MITVLTWLWAQPQSRTSYKAEHVNIWADMVRRHLSIPHEIACVTNMPKGIDSSIRIINPPGDFEGINNPKWANGRPQCYRRLAMFRRDAASIFDERFVCMDLDCVIGRSLDPLFDRSDDLVLFKGTSPGRPYNGSMMLIQAGCRPHVYEGFTEAGALAASENFVGSDQAWLATALGGGEATWSEPDGVYWYGSRYRIQGRKDARVLFFPGKLKPWTLMAADRFIFSNYRATVREAA